MKESIGYTVTLNIVIVFIVVIFAFLSAAIIYFKSNKINNVIINSIEKYEGYNDLSAEEINRQMFSWGYARGNVSCNEDEGYKGCPLTSNPLGRGQNGYCVYECNLDQDYYFYRIRTNMKIDLPIINNILIIPIYSSTNEMFNYQKNLG